MLFDSLFRRRKTNAISGNAVRFVEEAQHGSVSQERTPLLAGTNHRSEIKEAVKALKISTDAKSAKLGTFDGVFVPTSLNVLSILMFLRFGFILGQSGFVGMMGKSPLCRLRTTTTARFSLILVPR